MSMTLYDAERLRDSIYQDCLHTEPGAFQRSLLDRGISLNRHPAMDHRIRIPVYQSPIPNDFISISSSTNNSNRFVFDVDTEDYRRFDNWAMTTFDISPPQQYNGPRGSLMEFQQNVMNFINPISVRGSDLVDRYVYPPRAKVEFEIWNDPVSMVFSEGVPSQAITPFLEANISRVSPFVFCVKVLGDNNPGLFSAVLQDHTITRCYSQYSPPVMSYSYRRKMMSDLHLTALDSSGVMSLTYFSWSGGAVYEVLEHAPHYRNRYINWFREDLLSNIGVIKEALVSSIRTHRTRCFMTFIKGKVKVYTGGPDSSYPTHILPTLLENPPTKCIPL